MNKRTEKNPRNQRKSAILTNQPFQGVHRGRNLETQPRNVEKYL